MRESSPHACTFYIRTQILPQLHILVYIRTRTHIYICWDLPNMQNHKFTRHIKSRRHRRRCPVLLYTYVYTTRVHHTSTFIIIMQHLWLSNAKQLSDFWSCVQMSLCSIWEAMRRPAAGGGIDTYTYIKLIHTYVYLCVLLYIHIHIYTYYISCKCILNYIFLL